MKSLLLLMKNLCTDISFQFFAKKAITSRFYAIFSENLGQKSNLFLETKAFISSNSVFWKCSTSLIDGKSHPAGKQPNKILHFEGFC